MSKLKQGLILITIFILTTFTAFYLENYNRIFVREIFKYFYGDNVIFLGKDFHLFASWKLVIAFGLFCVITYLIVSKTTKNKIVMLAIAIFTFFMSLILISYLDITDRIVTCTTCKDNTRKIFMNEISYDNHFVLSLIIALLPLLLVVFKNRKAKIT